MARYFKHDLNFMGVRKVFFIVSGTLCAISIIALCVLHLNLGIEFIGGTSVTFNDTGAITLDEMRSACAEAGIPDATIQVTNTGGTPGFLLRTNTTDPNESASYASAVADNLGLSTDSYEVSVIGPDWGTTVLRSTLIAFLVAMALIITYISLRFRDYKMGLMAVLALFHDLLIIIGFYALFQIEVSPNVVAALLTIMGYSLYDTVVVFHRMNENANTKMKCSFMSMANHSINQVFTRTINTTLTSIIPVLAMLIFGGETLKGFAIAMTIGLITGSYSSFAIASPLYVLWKEKEPTFAKLKKRYGYESHVTDNVIAGTATMDDVREAESKVDFAHRSEALTTDAASAKTDGAAGKKKATGASGSPEQKKEPDDPQVKDAATAPSAADEDDGGNGEAAQDGVAKAAPANSGSQPHRGKQSRAQRKKSSR